MFHFFAVICSGILRSLPAGVFAWGLAEKHAGAGPGPCAPLGGRWEACMVMAAMESYLAALCGTAAGFTGILCHVLELGEDCRSEERRVGKEC